MPNEPAGLPRLHLGNEYQHDEDVWLEEDTGLVWILFFGLALGFAFGAALVGLLWWLL